MNQGAGQEVMDCIAWMIKTEEQLNKMMDYLISIRDKRVKAEQVILKANKIVTGSNICKKVGKQL